MSMGAPVARVTLLGKDGCHLCDDARAVIARVCADLGVDWTEVDITTDEALFERYRDEIPVTLVDGEQHDIWYVSEDRLRRALEPAAET
jgi:glutaredoxin